MIKVKVFFTETKVFLNGDMLFIKKVLERTRKNPNEAHKKVIASLSKHVANQLNIDKVPIDNNKFLRTLINDYIVLTR